MGKPGEQHAPAAASFRLRWEEMVEASQAGTTLSTSGGVSWATKLAGTSLSTITRCGKVPIWLSRIPSKRDWIGPRIVHCHSYRSQPPGFAAVWACSTIKNPCCTPDHQGGARGLPTHHQFQGCILCSASHQPRARRKYGANRSVQRVLPPIRVFSH